MNPYPSVWRARLHPERRGQRCRIVRRARAPAVAFSFDSKIDVEFDDGTVLRNVHRNSVRRMKPEEDQ